MPPLGALQAGALQPVAWFQLFDRVQHEIFIGCLEATGYDASGVVPQARKAYCDTVQMCIVLPMSVYGRLPEMLCWQEGSRWQFQYSWC